MLSFSTPLGILAVIAVATLSSCNRNQPEYNSAAKVEGQDGEPGTPEREPGAAEGVVEPEQWESEDLPPLPPEPQPSPAEPAPNGSPTSGYAPLQPQTDSVSNTHPGSEEE